MKRWYAVRTRTGKEELAILNLRRQLFDVFLPYSYRTIRHARKIRTIRAAFFPGYLFIAFDIDRDRWRSVDGTSGVVGLIKACERPVPAPPGLVETLIAANGPGGVIDLARALQAGTSVRLIAGPFANQLAVVERLAGPNRVRILLSMMNQIVPVEVQRAVLAAV